MPLSATAQRSQSLHSLCQQNLVKKKEVLTGVRENGSRRRLREREGEVHRREPDLGSVLLSPTAASNCTRETDQSCNGMSNLGRSRNSAPNRAVPQHRSRPTSLPSHPTGTDEGPAALCARVLGVSADEAREAGEGARVCEGGGRRVGVLGTLPLSAFGGFPCVEVGEYGTALARPHTSVGGVMSHAGMAHGTKENRMRLPQTDKHDFNLLVLTSGASLKGVFFRISRTL